MFETEGPKKKYRLYWRGKVMHEGCGTEAAIQRVRRTIAWIFANGDVEQVGVAYVVEPKKPKRPPLLGMLLSGIN